MGTLYLVATPLGNLEDITLRALRILREAKIIAAEDTRRTRKLLNHFAIVTPTISYHEHSGPAGTTTMLAALAEGDVALVSDAGTPAISDPGADLIQAALRAGYPVVPIPGPSAVITALIASGLSASEFTFLGFLPRKSQGRRAHLLSVSHEPRTLVIYEAPHRLRACLDDLLAVLGDREACLARELTKIHEQWLRGTLSALKARYGSQDEPRGEYTLVIAGASQASQSQTEEDPEALAIRTRDRLRELLAAGSGTRDAAAIVARELGQPRREMYQLALKLAET
ncbi:MAG TPA: 16S rRNA (cytidine(1402)-2'-O)-methyltransferase [Ktedonobacterales bacterium]|nr:16S rRNA (cytidine(1402)-2'-O)-methyltransferase [Ktedonobacterales bacterium]